MYGRFRRYKRRRFNRSRRYFKRRRFVKRGRYTRCRRCPIHCFRRRRIFVNRYHGPSSRSGVRISSRITPSSSAPWAKSRWYRPVRNKVVVKDNSGDSSLWSTVKEAAATLPLAAAGYAAHAGNIFAAPLARELRNPFLRRRLF